AAASDHARHAVAFGPISDVLVVDGARLPLLEQETPVVCGQLEGSPPQEEYVPFLQSPAAILLARPTVAGQIFDVDDAHRRPSLARRPQRDDERPRGRA